MIKIEEVNENSLEEAARIHSTSWQDSHKNICSAEFLAIHNVEHQRKYLLEKMKTGTKIYMLNAERPVGIVSVMGDLIEDLYVLPNEQCKGYGTELLKFAMGKCKGRPKLWILECNVGAERLYLRSGFKRTGARNKITDVLDEIEMEMDGSLEMAYRWACEEDAQLLITIYNASFHDDYVKYGECPAYGRSKEEMVASVKRCPKEIILTDGKPAGVASVNVRG